MTLTTPTVHLNGTSATELLEQVLHAAHKLHDAMAALDAAAPNNRDFYPQGPNAIITAQAEHASRVEKLRSVYDELHNLAEKISDQL